jgi:hypothetical protein
MDSGGRWETMVGEEMLGWACEELARGKLGSENLGMDP